jgi:minimal PKS acyl carrier protein
MTTTSPGRSRDEVVPHTFTLNDLRRIMRASVGVEDGVDLDGDISDVEFADLGYDSLAVLELAGHVKREYGVAVPDEVVLELRTPALAVTLVNGRLAEARG